LKVRLEQFMATKFPQQRESWWQRFVVRHWPLKVISFALAIVAWIAFAYNPSTIERTFVVPIEYRNVAPDLVLSDDAPAENRVTLSGTEPAFRLLEPSTLTISINLANATEGPQAIAIQQKDVNMPANLSLYGIEDNVIRLQLRKRPETPPAQR
jgi:YbbR domain-containing protein